MTRTLLVTSALPYANGSIHLGHMVEHIQTDIFVRFQKLIGNTCHYLCADDTHGTAIMLSAQKQNKTPEQYIDAIHTEHLADFTDFGIKYDLYYSTHSPENDRLSKDIFNKATEQNAIKKERIKQYFCDQSGLFLSDRTIQGTCPKCKAENQYGDACEQCYATYNATQLIDPISIYSKKTPVLKESDHYFFTLSKFQSTIETWLNTAPVTDPVKNKCKEWFSDGLKDWDISRDAPYFGITIPGTTDKYFYVWLDAPVGYIATTEKWAKTQHKSSDDYWKNPNIEIHHFIGKDILYFHTLFWPAMLSVANYELPKKVHVHGFLTVNGEKMSKSRGTFILARTYLDHLNPEFCRYYFASKLSPNMDDIDFNISDFVFKINSDIIGKVVNIASRLGAILNKKCAQKLQQIPTDAHPLLDSIRNKKAVIANHYEQINTQKAMKEIMDCADLANQYIDQQAPWSVAKEDPDKAADICTAGLNALRYLCIYLKPICPNLCTGIEAFLNSPPLSWKDLDTTLENHPITAYEHLAKRLDLDTVLNCIKP